MTGQQLSFDDRYNSLPGLEGLIALYIRDHGSSSSPVSIKDIQAQLNGNGGITEREVKAIIHDLRRTHGLPVMSRKGKPSGYWLCASVEEMQEWIKAFRSQALDELATVAKIVRVNYPHLAGQLDIEFKAVA